MVKFPHVFLKISVSLGSTVVFLTKPVNYTMMLSTLTLGSFDLIPFDQESLEVMLWLALSSSPQQIELSQRVQNS